MLPSATLHAQLSQLGSAGLGVKRGKVPLVVVVIIIIIIIEGSVSSLLKVITTTNFPLFSPYFPPSFPLGE